MVLPELVVQATRNPPLVSDLPVIPPAAVSTLWQFATLSLLASNPPSKKQQLRVDELPGSRCPAS